MKPSFVIIGAQKAGTTSLYHILCQHPCIKAADRKEINYFNKNYHLGLGWYESKFPLALAGAVETQLRGKPVITGEASPYYMFHPRTAPRLAATLPEARLIVLLRNPVDRAYSQYHHASRKNRETLSFEEAIAREPERLAGEAEKLLQDDRYFSFDHRYHSYLSRGIYVDQIQAFRRFFDEKQFLILKSEDFFSNTVDILRQTFEFLGVDNWVPPDLKPMNTGHYSQIKPETRERLRDYFAPHNKRLYEYLGRDFGW
jgi:hypothetical protein